MWNILEISIFLRLIFEAAVETLFAHVVVLFKNKLAILYCPETFFFSDIQVRKALNKFGNSHKESFKTKLESVESKVHVPLSRMFEELKTNFATLSPYVNFCRTKSPLIVNCALNFFVSSLLVVFESVFFNAYSMFSVIESWNS